MWRLNINILNIFCANENSFEFGGEQAVQAYFVAAMW